MQLLHLGIDDSSRESLLSSINTVYTRHAGKIDNTLDEIWQIVVTADARVDNHAQVSSSLRSLLHPQRN